VLRKSEHRSPANAGEAPEEIPAVPVEFLICFIRQVIRTYPSGDVYFLAMRAAKHDFPLTEEQQAAFMKAVFAESKRSAWPDGFF